MQHDQRGDRGKLDRKIAIGHCVERVGTNTVEAKLAGNELAVDREAGTCERRASQW